MRSLGHLGSFLAVSAAVGSSSAEGPRSGAFHGSSAILFRDRSLPFGNDGSGLDCRSAGNCIREEPRTDPKNKPTPPPSSPSPVPPFVPGSKFEMPEIVTTGVENMDVGSVAYSTATGVKSVAAVSKSIARSEAVKGVKGEANKLVEEIRESLARLLGAVSGDEKDLANALGIVDKGYRQVIAKCENFTLNAGAVPIIDRLEEIHAELERVKEISEPIRAYVDGLVGDSGFIRGYIRAAVQRIFDIFDEIAALEASFRIARNIPTHKYQKLEELKEKLAYQREILAGRAMPVNEVRAEKQRRFKKFNERKTLRKIVGLMNRLKASGEGGADFADEGLQATLVVDNDGVESCDDSSDKVEADETTVKARSKAVSVSEFDLSNAALQSMDLRILRVVDGEEMEVPVLSEEDWMRADSLRAGRSVLLRALSLAREELSGRLKQRKIGKRGGKKVQYEPDFEPVNEPEVVSKAATCVKEEEEDLIDEVVRERMKGLASKWDDNLCRFLEKCELVDSNITSSIIQKLGPNLYRIKGGFSDGLKFEVLVDFSKKSCQTSFGVSINEGKSIIEFFEDGGELTEIRWDKVRLNQEEISMDCWKDFLAIKENLVRYIRGESIHSGSVEVLLEFIMKAFNEDQKVSLDDDIEEDEIEEDKYSRPEWFRAKEVLNLSPIASKIMGILKAAKAERYKYQGEARKAERRSWQNGIVRQLLDLLQLNVVPNEALIRSYYRLKALVLLREEIMIFAKTEKCDFEMPAFLMDAENSTGAMTGSVKLQSRQKVARQA